MMDYYYNAQSESDINIELKDSKDDENHSYANKEELKCYETLQRKNIFETESNEHVYNDVEKQDIVYENTANLIAEPTTRLNTLIRKSVDNVYISFEAQLDNNDQTYDTLDNQVKERESEIYSTIPQEDENLRTENMIGIYKNLKYVRTKRASCLRRRWKLFLLLAIVLVVGITGLIIAVVLVTNEEQPVEFTENFESQLDTICSGSGSGQEPDDADDELTPFD